jgi:hypothetical protein
MNAQPDERIVARCLVGGCDWSIDVHAGHAVLPEIEKHRADKHPWVKPGRLHRVELEATATTATVTP